MIKTYKLKMNTPYYKNTLKMYEFIEVKEVKFRKYLIQFLMRAARWMSTMQLVFGGPQSGSLA